MPLRLFIDPDQRALVADLSGRSPQVPPAQVLGDTIALELYAPADLAGWNAAAGQISVGAIDATPTSGNYTLTWDANTTNAISYAATASDVQNALTSMNGGPSVTVAGNAGGPYLVAWNSVGARNSISSTGSGLYPASQVMVAEEQSGNASTIERQIITLRQNLTSANSFTALNAGNGSVTTLVAGGGGNNEVQQIQISPAYAGSFSLSFNGATISGLTPNTDAATLTNALTSLSTIGNGNAVATAIPDGYQVAFGNGLANTNVPTMTVGTNGLTFAVGRSCNLNLNTFNLAAAVGNNESRTLIFEGQFTISAQTQTVFRSPITVINDLIDTTGVAPTGSGYPAAGETLAYVGNFATYNAMMATTFSRPTDSLVAWTVANSGAGDEVSGISLLKSSGSRPAEAAPFVLHFSDNANTYLYKFL